ncbi:MAG: DUF5685 family protein [Lachnospiraceae bacterium]|nr:DUF5685 family protein [Lachnospiraceae bacterium]
MFGYIIINQGEMKFKEYDIYRAYYCGLCRKLKEKFGIRGQITLSYDMTFLVMLLTSLYEPETFDGKTNCIPHPFEKHKTKSNIFSEYAADMNILLTYFKCLDDWEDDKKYNRWLFSEFLRPFYLRIRNTYPDKAHRIEKAMADLKVLEKKKVDDIDKAAGLFGEIMAEITDYQADEWQDGLKRLGFHLGKFIYLMDAYEDIDKDLKDNNYNPFWKKYENPDFDEECHTILEMMMAECSKEFEKLPIIENIEILRNILYSGVWYRYEQIRTERFRA